MVAVSGAEKMLGRACAWICDPQHKNLQPNKVAGMDGMKVWVGPWNE